MLDHFVSEIVVIFMCVAMHVLQIKISLAILVDSMVIIIYFAEQFGQQKSERHLV